jgi:hypothetical protein
MEWVQKLRDVSRDVEFLPAASAAVINEAERVVGELPTELKELLAYSNGLVCRSFRLFSAFDRDQPKKTWESLQQVNNPQKTRALGGDRDLLARFLVFADIGGGFAVWDRTDNSLWFEETHDADLRQTDLSLIAFVETMVRNAE